MDGRIRWLDAGDARRGERASEVVEAYLAGWREGREWCRNVWSVAWGLASFGLARRRYTGRRLTDGRINGLSSSGVPILALLLEEGE